MVVAYYAQIRGRAATPIRPGAVTKAVLLGEFPLLPTGEVVREASIVDLHRTYKELIKRENLSRPRDRRLRGMTYRSFCTWFKFAQLLGLVRLTKELPLEFPPPGGDLLSIRKPDGAHVVVSVRRIFEITKVGAEDEKSWGDLCRAWMESWPAPQKVEYAPPFIPPIEKVKPLPKKGKIVGVWVPFTKVSRYSARQAGLLIKHLERLFAAGIRAEGVKVEVDRLAGMTGDWQIEMEDAIAKEKRRKVSDKEALAKYEKLLGSIKALSQALIDEDLEKAFGVLKEEM